jgi:hypothetical protein
VQFGILVLALSAVRSPLTSQTSRRPSPSLTDERFWLAGRYDTNRIIVYFEAVQFNGTLPSNAQQLADPWARGFYSPVKLPPVYVAQFQKGHDEREHFALGDKYDLLLDERTVATVTLTTLIGAETDEAVGNDSFIGALATLDRKDDAMFLSNSYYAVRRHHRPVPKTPKTQAAYAGLERSPVRFDIQTKIVDLLMRDTKSTAREAGRGTSWRISPFVDVQAFRLANGRLRYYARAAWNLEEGNEQGRKTTFGLAGWISPTPTLHILAGETGTSPYDGLDAVLPSLLNVVDLGEGRTGIIVSVEGQDSASTDLLEYRDGQHLGSMRVLQSIGTGE